MNDQTTACPVCHAPSTTDPRRADMFLLSFGLVVHNRVCVKCHRRIQTARGMTADERDRARAGRFAKTANADPAPTDLDGWDFL